MTAALGLTEGCRHDAKVDPAAAREVASVGAAPSPSATATTPAEPSAAVETSLEASVPFASSAAARPTSTAGNLSALAASVGIGAPSPHASGLGGLRGIVNQSCGAVDQPMTRVFANVATSVSSGAPGDDRAVAQLRSRLRACATQALDRDPNETGTLKLAVTVASSGEASSVVTQSNAGLAQGTVACMTAAMRHGQYGATAHQLAVTIVQTHQ